MSHGDPTRHARIDAALARRNYASSLIPRIEGLLDGREDPTRLSCCGSGCAVCVRELLAVCAEVRASEADCLNQPPQPAA